MKDFFYRFVYIQISRVNQTYNKMKIFLLIITILVVSQAQVLGIDFGTQFWKASLISPGKNLVIVENSRSGRKTINGLSFLDGVRHFEDDALYKRLKKPHMSYFYLNKLLRSLDFENPLEGYEYANGTYYITHEGQIISLEQLVGMILKNIKLHASKQAGSDIKDAVLAIPPSWGWRSKMALINAAYIADLSILGLINQNSAAAINFAITRNDTDPINIGFFNLGSHNLQFSIIQFFGQHDEAKGKNIESLKVLSHVVAQDVGGLQVDRAIADYLSEQFKKKHGLDPRTKQKSYVKLLHQAAQAKQTLSANKQAQVYVEGIMNGIDLNLPITRDVVENMEIFKKLNVHLDAAVEKAGISKGDLNCVEMIGGASRIPLISKIVKDHFDGIEVGSHINGDQAMAFGSSLRAANLSIAFRVKQLHFYDGFQKQIKCVISSLGQIITEQVLFTTNSQHGDKTYVHLSPPDEQIKIDLYYGDDVIKTYNSQNITAWKNVYKQTEYNFTANPNVVLGFVLSTTSIADLKENHVNITFNRTEVKTVDDWVEEEVKQQAKQEEQNAEQPENAPQKTQDKTQETAQTNQQAKNQDEKAPQQAENTNSTSNQSAESNNTQSPKKPRKPKAPKKKLVKVTKVVQQHRIQNKKHTIPSTQAFTKYPRYSKSQIQENQIILQRFEKHQKHLQEKSKIRNDLESTLYRLKDSYEDPYLLKFSKQVEMDNLKKVVSQKLEWLDQNAWTAEKDQFEKHFNHVFEAYSPMYNRSLQHNEREKKYNETMQFLSYTYEKTSDLNNTHSWLGDKIVNHLKKINETVEEIHKKLKKLTDQALNEDPVIYNNQMLGKAQRLREEYYLIKMLPRPKPVKTPKVETKQEEKTQQTSEDKQQGEQTQGKQAQSQGEQEPTQQSEQQQQVPQTTEENENTEENQTDDDL